MTAVLRRSADETLRAPFGFKAHNETFIDYCEAVIMEDGTIEYAVPSHVEFLKAAYRERFGTEPDDDCPEGRYLDYDSWLMERLHAVSVHTTFCTEPWNERQARSLWRLQTHGCTRFDARSLDLIRKF